MRQRVGVIGAGPAGLVTAKECLAQGMDVVLFEWGSQVGGQWDFGSGRSAVWDEMTMNTSRRMCEFSDFPWEENVDISKYADMSYGGVFAHHSEASVYLTTYASRFKLLERTHFNSRVVKIEKEQAGNRWAVHVDKRGTNETEIFSFDRVVVCSGRYIYPNKSELLESSCLGSFQGDVLHSQDFKYVSHFKNKRVLVVGSSVSGSEIVSVLCDAGCSKLVHSIRRSKYMCNKLVPASGVVMDEAFFTRLPLVLSKYLPSVFGFQKLQSTMLEVFPHHPEKMFPDQLSQDDMGVDLSAAAQPLPAGLCIASDYVSLVRAGKVSIKPSPESSECLSVCFSDGSAEDFDSIILATGFQLKLDFLPDDVWDTVTFEANDGKRELALYRHIFHPSFPDLAFVGLPNIIGPAWPAMEMQARLLSLTWSGKVPLPTSEIMWKGIEDYKQFRNIPGNEAMVSSEMQEEIAADLELQPTFWDLVWNPQKFLLGPLFPCQYRTSLKYDEPSVVAAARERFQMYNNNPQHVVID